MCKIITGFIDKRSYWYHFTLKIRAIWNPPHFWPFVWVIGQYTADWSKFVRLMSKSGVFMSYPGIIYYLWIESSHINAQDKQYYLKVSTTSIWVNIIFNISMLFNESWCGFIIKTSISLVQVPRVNNVFIHLILKCEVLPSCNPSLNCRAILPVLNSVNLTLPNFANLGDIQCGAIPTNKNLNIFQSPHYWSNHSLSRVCWVSHKFQNLIWLSDLFAGFNQICFTVK